MSLRIPEDLFDLLVEQANREDRSVNNLVIRLLRHDLAEIQTNPYAPGHTVAKKVAKATPVKTKTDVKALQAQVDRTLKTNAAKREKDRSGAPAGERVEEEEWDEEAMDSFRKAALSTQEKEKGWG